MMGAVVVTMSLLCSEGQSLDGQFKGGHQGL